MKFARIFARIIVGLVFIYSGFVKGIDPLGSTYKFSDYFVAFGAPWMQSIAFVLAVILCIIEFTIGMALVLGLKMKITSWITSIFMVFFTILTLILAIFNPVTDCGCFGDALILTNWQTFYKNLIILVPTLFVFIKRNDFQQYVSSKAEWLLVAVSAIVLLSFALFSYNNLPFFDFRPYKIGTHIQSGMEIPDDAPHDEYKTLLYYEKNGEVKEFSMENYPWDDSTWTFVETKNILIKEGYIPPIHDFVIETLDGTDITESILNNESYTFLLIGNNLPKSSTKRQNQINELAFYALDKGYDFYCLTASIEENIEEFRVKSNAPYEFCNTDEITLKTIIRSNPGLVLIKDGVIINKWHYNNIPQSDFIEKDMLSSSILSHATKSNKHLTNLILLLLIISIIVFYVTPAFPDKR